MTVASVGATRIKVLIRAPYLPVCRGEVPAAGKNCRKGPLVFTRKLDQTVIIAGFITVKLTWIEDRTAHVEVLAPRDVPLWPTQGAKVVALN
ncbi:MAG: hypothetical protein WCS85_05685 [Candidatus Peribacteraceae bacterium]